MKATKPEVFEKICRELAVSSKGLYWHCKNNGISTVTFYAWVDKDEKNLNRYTRAREEQAEYLADEILEIADDSTNDTAQIRRGKEIVDVENTEWTNRSKLRIESRKWIAAKLRPKKYGDKLDVSTTVKVEQPLFPEK